MTSATLFEKFIFFLATMIIARYLSAEHYGEYATALGIATFFGLVSNLGITGTAVRAINLKPEFKDQYYSSILVLKTFLSLVIYGGLLCYLALASFMQFYNTDPVRNKSVIILTVIFGLVRLSTEFIQTTYSLLEAKEKFKLISGALTLFSILYITGTLIAVLYNGDYFDIVSIRLGINLIFMLGILYTLTKFYTFNFKIKNLKIFLIESIPFSLTFIFANVIINTSIFLLPVIHETVYAGYYQNAFLFYISISFIPISMAKVLLPFLYKFKFDVNPDKFQFAFKIYSKFFSIVSFFFLIIFFIFSHELITYIFGDKYSESIPVLQVFALAVPFSSNPAPWIITTLDKQEYNSLINGIATVINIIANILLIWYFKAEGAAAAMVITFAVIYLLSHIYLVKNGYVRYTPVFLMRLKLLITVVCIYLVNRFIFQNTFFIIPLAVSVLVYLAVVYIFIMEKDDFRIIRETLSLKRSE